MTSFLQIVKLTIVSATGLFDIFTSFVWIVCLNTSMSAFTYVLYMFAIVLWFVKYVCLSSVVVSLEKVTSLFAARQKNLEMCAYWLLLHCKWIYFFSRRYLNYQFPNCIARFRSICYAFSQLHRATNTNVRAIWWTILDVPAALARHYRDIWRTSLTLWMTGYGNN